MIRCAECYWASLNTPCCGDRVCCNTHSKNYNKVFSVEEARKRGCDYGTRPDDVCCEEMSPWFLDFGYLS